MTTLDTLADAVTQMVDKGHYDGHDLGNVFILAMRLDEAAATQRDIRIRLLLQKAHCQVRDAHHAAIDDHQQAARDMLAVARFWIRRAVRM